MPKPKRHRPRYRHKFDMMAFEVGGEPYKTRCVHPVHVKPRKAK